MNSMNSIKGKLYGIGIGPGDPKLLTLRAKEILDRIDTIFVPKGDDSASSCARSIIEKNIEGNKSFIELVFPMTKDKKKLVSSWQNIAQRIALEISKKKKAAFVTIGDPFIYSTYVYLFKMLTNFYPSITLETIPGISAFNAASSRANFPLVEGNEKMAVLPVTKNLSGLKKALKEFETVVLMKVGSKLEKVVKLLREMGLIKNAILVSRVGQANEKIIYNLNNLKDRRIGYLSVIIVKKGRRAESKGQRVKSVATREDAKYV